MSVDKFYKSSGYYFLTYKHKPNDPKLFMIFNPFVVVSCERL